MIKNVAVALCLMVVLSSCIYDLWPNLGIELYNTTNVPYVSSSYTPCAGGLKATYTFPASGVTDTYRVAANEEQKTYITHKSNLGDKAILEAWCFDGNNQEIGYGKFVTVFIRRPAYVSVVSAPPANPSPKEKFCWDGWTEVRGNNPPCFYDDF